MDRRVKWAAKELVDLVDLKGKTVIKDAWGIRDQLAAKANLVVMAAMDRLANRAARDLTGLLDTLEPVVQREIWDSKELWVHADLRVPKAMLAAKVLAAPLAALEIKANAVQKVSEALVALQAREADHLVNAVHEALVPRRA